MTEGGDVSESDDFIQGEWAVIEIGGEPITSGRTPLLRFDSDGRVTGTAGVNRLMGGYEFDGGQLSLSRLATTMMAGPRDAMKTEVELLSALGTGGDLELVMVLRNRATGAEVLLRRVPVPREGAAPAPAPVSVPDDEDRPAFSYDPPL